MNRDLWYLIGGGILLFLAGIGFSQSILRPHHPRFSTGFDHPGHEYNMQNHGNTNCNCNNNCGCNSCNCGNCGFQAANCNCSDVANGQQRPMTGGCPKMMKKMGMSDQVPMMDKPHHKMRNSQRSKTMPNHNPAPDVRPDMTAPQPMPAE